MLTDDIRTSVKLELSEMKKLDINVPIKAFKIVDTLSEDELESMSVSEMADMCINLS